MISTPSRLLQGASQEAAVSAWLSCLSMRGNSLSSTSAESVLSASESVLERFACFLLRRLAEAALVPPDRRLLAP